MEKLLFSEQEMSLFVLSLANQIMAKNESLDDVALIGILPAGLPLAERLAKLLKKKIKNTLLIGEMDIGLYRDNIRHDQHFVTIRETDIPFDITNKHIIIVNDILFHGRTIRAALDGLLDFGAPALIEAAVLIDRGHRRLPVFANYVGKYLETDKADKLKVCFYEIDGEDKIFITD